MKKPVVDYGSLRLRRLNEPQYAHIRLLAGWLVYFALYFLTENLIPVSRCHVIHSALDDLIPFHEGFLILYCYWYVLLVGSLLYFILYDIPAFKQLQVYIMMTQAMAMLAYIVYPSVQLLRPESFARDNVLTRLMGLIYAFDTPTGVCPSLHVAYSVGIASVWCRRAETPKAWKAGVVVSAVLISISTTFVKQHSAVDVFAALPVCAVCEVVLYGHTPGRLAGRLRRYLSEGPRSARGADDARTAHIETARG